MTIRGLGVDEAESLLLDPCSPRTRSPRRKGLRPGQSPLVQGICSISGSPELRPPIPGSRRARLDHSWIFSGILGTRGRLRAGHTLEARRRAARPTPWPNDRRDRPGPVNLRETRHATARDSRRRALLPGDRDFSLPWPYQPMRSDWPRSSCQGYGIHKRRGGSVPRPIRFDRTTDGPPDRAASDRAGDRRGWKDLSRVRSQSRGSPFLRFGVEAHRRLAVGRSPGGTGRDDGPPSDRPRERTRRQDRGRRPPASLKIPR